MSERLRLLDRFRVVGRVFALDRLRVVGRAFILDRFRVAVLDRLLVVGQRLHNIRQRHNFIFIGRLSVFDRLRVAGRAVALDRLRAVFQRRQLLVVFRQRLKDIRQRHNVVKLLNAVKQRHAVQGRVVVLNHLKLKRQRYAHAAGVPHPGGRDARHRECAERGLRRLAVRGRGKLQNGAAVSVQRNLIARPDVFAAPCRLLAVLDGLKFKPDEKVLAVRAHLIRGRDKLRVLVARLGVQDGFHGHGKLARRLAGNRLRRHTKRIADRPSVHFHRDSIGVDNHIDPRRDLDGNRDFLCFFIFH